MERSSRGTRGETLTLVPHSSRRLCVRRSPGGRIPPVRRGLKFVLLVAAVAACEARADRRGATVLYASGADLPSMNSLLTLLPLAKQVQKFALLTTLARYDAGLVPQPYLARVWRWSDDRRVLTFVLHSDVRWHDGRLTTARDVAWTIDAARDPATQYPRVADLADVAAVTAPDDSTVVIRFRAPPGAAAGLPG